MSEEATLSEWGVPLTTPELLVRIHALKEEMERSASKMLWDMYDNAANELYLCRKELDDRNGVSDV